MSGVRWMFHATAMGPSYDALFGSLERLFGCRVLHCEEDERPGVQRRGGMTWLGDNSIELGEPLGADSPVAPFVQRFGGGMHSVAVQVDDVDAALRRAAGFGVEVARFIAPDMAFTRPATTAGLLLEWSSHRQEDDPRWGAPEPMFVERPVVLATQMAFVGAVTADPVADAQRLALILDTGATVLDPDPGAADPAAVVALGDCVLALFPLCGPDESRRVWGDVFERPRVHCLGLGVADLDAAVDALGAAGVSVRHRSATGVVLEGTPFPVVVVERRLGGDPRDIPPG